MKINKKQAGLIAGLVCVLLLILLLLTMCNGGGNSSDQNKPTESSGVVETTGEAQSPEETTEAVEETTEATEETTEATEETTAPTTGSNNSKPGGTTGYNPDSGTTGGNNNDNDDDDEEETVAETTPAAGSQGSPYTETVTDFPNSVSTVVLPAGSTIYYNLNITDKTLTAYGESLLTIADADAYVIYNGTTFKASNGVVSVPIAAPKSVDTPVSIQVGNSNARSVVMNFQAPLGTRENPVPVSADAQGLIAISTALQAGDADGWYYQFTAAEDGILELQMDSVTEGVICDILVVAGEKTIKLSDSQDGKLSLDVAKDETVSIQIVTTDSTHPAANVAIIGTIQYAQLGSAQRPETVTDADGVITIDKTLDSGDADGYHYQYTATDDSTLTLKVDQITEGVECDLVVTVGDVTQKLSGSEADSTTGEKVVSVDLMDGETATIQVITVPNAGGVYPEAEVTISGTINYALGTKNNPIPIYNVPFETDTIEPGNAAYYSVYGAGGLTLTIADADAYITVGEEKYTAGENGSVSVDIAAGDPKNPVILSVGNSGGTAEAYTINVSYPVGSMNNPAELKIGENTAEVAVSADGYFFTWTADVEGLLTISIDTQNSSSWFYAISNTTSSTYGDNHLSTDQTVVSSETIGVMAGDVIQVIVNTADSSAGTVLFDAEFGDKQVSAVSDTALNTGTNSLKSVSTAATTIYKFTPAELGTYLLETSAGTLSCWTGDGDALNNTTTEATASLTVTSEGETVLVGISGCNSCTLTVTKTAVFESDNVPKADALTLDSTEIFVNVDLTQKYTLYLDEDGFYHREENGPLILLDFTDSTYKNLVKLLEESQVYCNVTAQDGTVTREIYDDLLSEYIKCAAEVEISEATEDTEAVVRTLYPLTEDLVYILTNAGAQLGWYDSTGSGYLFKENNELEAESTWMFACCYAQTPHPVTEDEDKTSEKPDKGGAEEPSLAFEPNPVEEKTEDLTKKTEETPQEEVSDRDEPNSEESNQGGSSEEGSTPGSEPVTQDTEKTVETGNGTENNEPGSGET